MVFYTEQFADCRLRDAFHFLFGPLLNNIRSLNRSRKKHLLWVRGVKIQFIKWSFHLTFLFTARTSGMILSKWKISTIKRRRLCLFTVCQTLRRLVVECHSHILCSLCGTSLLTLASSTLNSISIRRRRVPWWFALMSQSISFFLPTEAFHGEIKSKHQAATLNHPHAERLIQFEHLVLYSKILDSFFFCFKSSYKTAKRDRKKRWREPESSEGHGFM